MRLIEDATSHIRKRPQWRWTPDGDELGVTESEGAQASERQIREAVVLLMPLGKQDLPYSLKSTDPAGGTGALWQARLTL
jgi:hypothetical protein